MATKRVSLNSDDFVKINNGGVVDSANFVMQVLDGKVLIGSSDKDTNPPKGKDCYQIDDNFTYVGDDDVYVKSLYKEAIIIVDKA